MDGDLAVGSMTILTSIDAVFLYLPLLGIDTKEASNSVVSF